MKAISEIVERLKALIKTENPDNDPDARRWGYQEGIVISINEAKEILKFIESKKEKNG